MGSILRVMHVRMALWIGGFGLLLWAGCKTSSVVKTETEEVGRANSTPSSQRVDTAVERSGDGSSLDPQSEGELGPVQTGADGPVVLNEREVEELGEIDQDPPEMLESSAPAGFVLLPEFKAELPVRVSMPVPIFPDWIDFDVMIPGWVEFMVKIDTTGDVIDVTFIEASHPDLRAPAEAALREAVYTPVYDPQGLPFGVSFRDRVEF